MDKISFEKYLEDMSSRLPISVERFRIHYENVTEHINDDFIDCSFYKEIKKQLKNLDAEYFKDYEFRLLNIHDSMNMKIKDFYDMLDKCYREDVIYNKKYDYDDKDWRDSYEWMNCKNIYIKLKDIIRTRIYIRYLDGIELVCNLLDDLSIEFGYGFLKEYKSDDTGYYGVHCNFLIPFEIPALDPGTESQDCYVEIQLTTQIKSIVNELLWKSYEKKRSLVEDLKKDWHWDYQSKDFVVNYLGHIVHYTEGMIMDARKKMYE